jgi:hypothetical protein
VKNEQLSASHDSQSRFLRCSRHRRNVQRGDFDDNWRGSTRSPKASRSAHNGCIRTTHGIRFSSQRSVTRLSVGRH